MRKLYTFGLVLASFSLGFSTLSAQHFNVSVGLNLGYSRLHHNTRFETTTLRNLYETIKLTHPEGYPWEKFSEDFQLRQQFMMPRFGFSALLSHRELPLVVIGELMSSTSTYEKMSYGFTVGFGQEFSLIDNHIRGHFLGGYKMIWDRGFGSTTLVNSIGHKDARNLVSTYFDPDRPLGPTRGNLFALRGGIGKTLDSDRQWSFGVEGYAELDVTPRIKRESRMTNIGVNVFVRYQLVTAGNRYPAFNNNPAYYY